MIGCQDIHNKEKNNKTGQKMQQIMQMYSNITADFFMKSRG